MIMMMMRMMMLKLKADPSIMLRTIARVASITSDHAHSLHIVMIIINTMVVLIFIM